MNRRKFIQLGLAFGLIPLVDIESHAAPAQQELSEDDPQAKGLNYVKEASKAKGHARYKEGDLCKNCFFFKPEQGNGCTLFGMKRVEENGWCAAWAPMAK